ALLEARTVERALHGDTGDETVVAEREASVREALVDPGAHGRVGQQPEDVVSQRPQLAQRLVLLCRVALLEQRVAQDGDPRETDEHVAEVRRLPATRPLLGLVELREERADRRDAAEAPETPAQRLQRGDTHARVARYVPERDDQVDLRLGVRGAEREV